MDEEEITFVNGRYQVKPKGGPPPLPTALPTPRRSTTKSNGSAPSTPKKSDVPTSALTSPSVLEATLSLRPRDNRRTALGQNEKDAKAVRIEKHSSLVLTDLSALKNDLNDWGNSPQDGPSTDRTHRARTSKWVQGSVEPLTPRATESHRRSSLLPSASVNVVPTTTKERPLNRSSSIMLLLKPSEEEHTKKKEEEREYMAYLERAQKENFDSLQALKMIYQSGYDNFNRPIIVIVASLIPAKTVDLEKLLLFFIKILDPVVDQDYVLIYVHTNTGTENIPKFAWLRKCYGIFSRKYKKNLKALYIVQPSNLIKGVAKLFKPFLSNKFWKKLHYIDEVKELYIDMNPQEVQLPIELLPSGNKTKPEIFGVPLDEAMKHPMNTYAPIPIVVLNCLKYLYKNATQTEGIFRLSGRQQRIQELRDAYDRGEVVDISNEPDIHAIAGLLKLYFRILPDPICHYSLYRDWISSYDSTDMDLTKHRIKGLLLKLPETNFLTLSSLMGLLNIVNEQRVLTKMPAPNLAICWAPNILRPKEESLSAVLLESNIINSVVALLITESNHFFPVFSVMDYGKENT